MLLAAETMPNGTQRIYATRLASVVSYFEDDGEGGTKLYVEPGWYASPFTVTPEKLHAVRTAVLEDVAQRLNCPPDKVEYRSMSELYLVTDDIQVNPHTRQPAQTRSSKFKVMRR